MKSNVERSRDALSEIARIHGLLVDAALEGRDLMLYLRRHDVLNGNDEAAALLAWAWEKILRAEEGGALPKENYE